MRWRVRQCGHGGGEYGSGGHRGNGYKIGGHDGCGHGTKAYMCVLKWVIIVCIEIKDF